MMLRATIALTIVLAGNSAAIAQEPDATLPRSVEAKKQQLEDVEETRRRLRARQSAANELLRFLSALDEALARNTPKPTVDLTAERTGLLTVLKELKALPGDTKLYEEEQTSQRFGDALVSLSRVVDRSVPEATLPEIEGYRFDEESAALIPRVLDVSSFGGDRINYAFELFETAQAPSNVLLAKCNELWGRIPRDERDAPQRSELDSRLDAALTEVEQLNVENLSTELEKARKSAQDTVKESRPAVDNELKRIDAELKEQNKIYDSLDSALQKVDSLLEQQTVLNQTLMYATILMIVVLLLMFLSLRLFPAHTTALLITERTLVEIISMAFLLLTIIILGTGGKLVGESLGTLLGTIAGYILGRRMLEGERNRSNT